MKIVWLPTAIASRNRQLAHVASESPQMAIELGDRIERQLPKLAQFPEMGRTGRESGTRELVIRRTPFVVIYRINTALKRIEILHILHGAQQWPRPES